MKIISIRQPWASLIVSGAKDVENRTWSTRYRGPILIHASRTVDKISNDEFQARFEMPLPAALLRGGVIGTAEIVDCVGDHPSRWYAVGHYAFVLANPRPVPFIRWKEALSLRDAPGEVTATLTNRGPPPRRRQILPGALTSRRSAANSLGSWAAPLRRALRKPLRRKQAQQDRPGCDRHHSHVD